MLTYEQYDQKIHQLFEAAYGIRCSPDSITSDLLKAANIIDEALSLTSEMETQVADTAIRHEIMVDRLRCYIEQLAIYSRLLKQTYGTPQFDGLSQQQEEYCKRYMYVYSQVDNEEVRQSQRQLTIMAYQSLAACYFRRGGMGKDKALCQQAISCLDEAMQLTKGDKLYDVLQANKQQILQAITPA